MSECCGVKTSVFCDIVPLSWITHVMPDIRNFNFKFEGKHKILLWLLLRPVRLGFSNYIVFVMTQNILLVMKCRHIHVEFKLDLGFSHFSLTSTQDSSKLMYFCIFSLFVHWTYFHMFVRHSSYQTDKICIFFIIYN